MRLKEVGNCTVVKILLVRFRIATLFSTRSLPRFYSRHFASALSYDVWNVTLSVLSDGAITFPTELERIGIVLDIPVALLVALHMLWSSVNRMI